MLVSRILYESFGLTHKSKVCRVPTQSQYLEFTVTSYLYIRRVVRSSISLAPSPALSHERV